MEIYDDDDLEVTDRTKPALHKQELRHFVEMEVINIKGVLETVKIKQDPTFGIRPDDIVTLNPRFKNSYSKGELPDKLTVTYSYVRQLADPDKRSAYTGILKFKEVKGIFVNYHFKRIES
jgi:hypothetical protein